MGGELHLSESEQKGCCKTTWFLQKVVSEGGTGGMQMEISLEWRCTGTFHVPKIRNTGVHVTRNPLGLPSDDNYGT
jgi:hypothetical protein